MKIIRNIGLVDIRNASPQALSDISTINGIGVLVYFSEQLEAMKHIKIKGIGTQLSLSRDEDINVIFRNGDLKISRSFMDELAKPVIVMLNGTLTVEPTVTCESVKNIKKMMINGTAYVPDHLSAAFEAVMQVNGEVRIYDGNSLLIDRKFKLDDTELYGFKPGSRISVDTLIATSPIDEVLLSKALESIYVLDAMVISQHNLKAIAPLVQNYSQVEKTIVPEGHVYYNDLSIDEGNIGHWQDPFIYVGKKLTITAAPSDVLLKIKGIRCRHLEAPQNILDAIMPIVHDAKKITVLGKGAMKNMSSLEIDQAYLNAVEQLRLSNYGQLKLNEDIAISTFTEKVASLENYGMIKCSEALKPYVLEKIGTNYGVVNSKEKDKEADLDENVQYIENMGSYIL